MEKAKDNTNFNEMVKEIEEEKILLPDFQRRFTWTQKEMQNKLVASVLCKMPIGSILMLQMKGCDFAARHIGSNNVDILLETEEMKEFLLDGQQRVTVMVNAFSDLLHEGAGTQVNSLYRRYFLGIAKPQNEDYYTENYWGLNDLHFPLSDPENGSLDFMTDDIVNTLVVEDFRKKDITPYNPYFKDEDKGSPLSYCLSNKEYYLIPLYLLVKRKADNVLSKNRKLLGRILEGIAKEHLAYLLNRYDEMEDVRKREWIKDIVEDKTITEDDEQLQRFIDGREELEEELDRQCRCWQEDMGKYLVSCIEHMGLHIMDAPNSNRAKAIEVFENLNRGGAKLKTFDLMMARAARADKEFSRKLKEECQKEREYDKSFLGDNLQTAFEKYQKKLEKEGKKYLALRETKCVDGDFDTTFQDTFLNVLAICGKEDGELRKYREEMSKENILRLEPNFISTHYGQVCESMDRAAFFLQARCGIRSITEVNYKLMYTVLSYLFLKEEVYQSRKVWSLLTVWYWCAVFAGRYDKDQNVQAERDLRHLTAIIEGREDITYVKAMAKDAFNCPDFSQKDFLLYKESDNKKIYPKEVLGNYICQFYLADGYMDVINEQAFLSVFPSGEEGTELEKHHIIPVLSMQSMRESEKKLKADAREDKGNILNSPLNYVYIAKTSNKQIAANDIGSYIRYLKPAALYKLDFPDMEGIEEKNVTDILSARYEKLIGKLEEKAASCFMVWENAVL